MVSDALKKYRDVFSFGLLAVAVLYLISGLSLLVKSEEDSFLDFAGRAAQTGYLFAHPFVVFPLVGAVALAIGFGEASRSARAIVVGALVIGVVALVLGLVSWFAAFAYDGPSFGGVITAGKVVSIFLGLAQLLMLALALTFGVVALQTLPKRIAHPQQWGAPSVYGQQQGWGQPDPQQWGQQQGWGQPDPQQWGQQQWGGQPGQQWGQHAAPQQPWGQPPQPEQQAWGQPPPPDQSTWGQPEQQQTWGQPPPPEQQQQGWSQPEQPQSWAQPEQPEQPEQQAWAQPEQAEQQAWAQPEQAEQQVWAPAESDPSSSPADVSQDPDGRAEVDAAEPIDTSETEAESTADDTTEGQQDGWWQRPSQ